MFGHFKMYRKCCVPGAIVYERTFYFIGSHLKMRTSEFGLDILKTSSSEHNYSKKCHCDHNYALPSDRSSNEVACLEVVEVTDLIQPSSSSQPTTYSLSENEQPEIVSDLLRTSNEIVRKQVVRNIKSLAPQWQSLYKEYRKVKLQNNYMIRSNSVQ